MSEPVSAPDSNQRNFGFCVIQLSGVYFLDCSAEQPNDPSMPYGKKSATCSMP
jgi:hypothetical protein